MIPDLKTLPTKPGVYIYKNNDNKIIYIGKAINLKKRVSQYFQSNSALGPKTKTLVSQIAKIDTIVVDSEIQALILESSLIKQYKPKYNSQLTDDKNYLYICISKEKYPRIITEHKTKLDQNKYHIFGPFPDISSVKYLLKTLRSIFPYHSFKNKHPINCLYCHLNLCPGPKPDIKDYRKTISRIKKILSGGSKQIIDQLQKEMYQFSQNQNYELALSRKRQIESLVYINSSWKSIAKLTNNINLPIDTWQSAINELLSLFPKLKSIDRIEAYDISNSNNFYVGSMVVFQNNHVDNSAYRQFKIKTKQSQDDQHMISEIVCRRLKHLDWPKPDLIIVDGGKAQVSAVQALIKNKNILLIGLAKKEESLILYQDFAWQEIKLPKFSNAQKLLMHLRDESHRFANRYRLKLLKSIYEN